jgi:transposase
VTKPKKEDKPMMREKLVQLRGQHKRALRRRARKAKDAAYRCRCLIILKLGRGLPTTEVEKDLEIARATASRVAARFRDEGMAGLIDHRVLNGQTKVTSAHLQKLEEFLDKSPQDYGWQRPTWTRELLVEQLRADTGLELSCKHMGQLLRLVGARWKSGRPVVLCPWPRRKRLLHVARLRRMLRELPPDEVAFYADEVDINLNPKIGYDWMWMGTQKWIVTPGKNKKAYLAGAIDTRSGKLVWIVGESKNSDLFIRQMHDLSKRYRRYRKIHLVLDNYIIHSSRKTRRALAELGGRVVLHYLPPYCQANNPIEQVWRELHANVTRNHKCSTLSALLTEVDDCLHALSPFPGSKASLRKAA